MRQRTSVLRKTVVIAQCKKVWEGWEGDLPLMILGLIDCDAWRVAIDVSLFLLLLFLNIPSAKNDLRTRGVFEGCCVTCGKCVAVVIGMEGGSAVTPAYSFAGKVRVLGSLYSRAPSSPVESARRCDASPVTSIVFWLELEKGKEEGTFIKIQMPEKRPLGGGGEWAGSPSQLHLRKPLFTRGSNSSRQGSEKLVSG